MSVTSKIRSVNDFLEHLEGVKKQGDGWQARCPVHEDNNPSLSINQADKKILIKCHAGCKTQDIVKRIGLEMADLFLNNGQARTKPRRKIVKTYDYTDENEKLLFQTVRYEPKHFSQRRPKGHGGWIGKLGDVRRVLYRLPDLQVGIKSETNILLVEGEKDADRLFERGLVATTAPLGASKWNSAYTASLQGAHVVVIPDNDQSGRDHTEKIKKALLGTAASIKVVQLPDLDEKQDVSDWFDKGHTVEELQILIDQTDVTAAHQVLSARPAPQNQIKFPRLQSNLATEFADLYSQHVESPWEFLFFSFLTVVGCLVGHRVTLDSELKPQPRLYTVLLGNSADARKSSAISFVITLVREALELPIHHGLGSIEGLGRFLSEFGDKYFVNTRECYPLLLVFDELKIFVEKAKQNGSSALPMLCSLFENNYYDNSTKTRSVNLKGVYFSQLSACTADTFESMWTPAFRDIGYLNRLWLVEGQSDRRFALPKVIPEEKKDRIRKDLKHIIQTIDTLLVYAEFYQLSLSDGARELWNDYYADIPRSPLSRRLDTYGMRLMILLALLGRHQIVDEAIVQDVIKLLDWQLEVRRNNDPIDTENSIAHLEGKIVRSLETKGPMKKRALQRSVNSQRFGTWAWKNAIENLRDDERILKQDGLYLLIADSEES